MRGPGQDAQTARARVLTGSLFQQLTHVARTRNSTPCETYEQFKGFKPFIGATDPWGHKVVYQCLEGEMRVTSMGADAALGTDDDIVNGRIVGLTPALAATQPAVKPAAEEPDSGSSKKRRFGILLALFVGAVVATVVVRDVNS